MSSKVCLPALVVLLNGCVLLHGCFLDSTGYGVFGGSGGTGGSGNTGGETSTGGTAGMGGSSTTGGSSGTGGSLPCTDGDTQSCYSGVAGTKDIGTCKAGQQTCIGTDWGPCKGEVLPESMDIDCDDLDSDCDGEDDVAEGCAAFSVTDTCQGVLLLNGGNAIVPEGSSPDTMACFNGTVKQYVNPGDVLYILENDSEVKITIWNIDPVDIAGRIQADVSAFDHASMLAQYQIGAFDTVGLTITQAPVPNGKQYTIVRAGTPARPSFALSF